MYYGVNKISNDLADLKNPDHTDHNGRKVQITPEIVAETRRRFKVGLKASPFKTYQQWAWAADMHIRNFVRAQRCQNIPNMGTAAVIAGVAGLQIDDLWGHLKPGKRHRPKLQQIRLEEIDLDEENANKRQGKKQKRESFQPYNIYQEAAALRAARRTETDVVPDYLIKAEDLDDDVVPEELPDVGEEHIDIGGALDLD